MKKTAWLNAALFAAVVALALLVWLKPQPATEIKLTELTPPDVSRIMVEIAGTAPIVLERGESAWRMVTPLTAPADDFQMQQLLAILDASSKQQLPATGLARYDLNEPYIRVTFNRQTYSFGTINPMSREQYVLTQSNVHLIELRYAAALPKSVLQLVGKQLFSANEVPVGFQTEQYTLALRELRWRLTPAADVSADEIARWVDGWRTATALAVLPPSGRKPLSTMRVKLKSGAEITLAVLQRTPDLVLARSDRKIEYRFTAEAAQRLLAAPGAGTH